MPSQCQTYMTSLLEFFYPLFYDFILDEDCILPPTKACCQMDTTFLTTFSSLLAKTFTKSLYNLPNKLMGLKFVNSSAPPF